ncbi:MAG TPA: DNA-binding domain-containing protein [Candidatus Didemnitutus sp.]|nr:DNA-binding domain-containing protein [Candidatus Didemnitutus sp.]
MPAKPTKTARRFAPEAVRSTRDLADLQRAMWALISRPLASNSRMPRQWRDGRPTAALAAQIARPNDRLTSVERLEIYSRMYWFRILDSLYDDCPGLRAVIGDRRFLKMAEAYFTRYPSRSFTMRNLPSRLARFLREEPAWTKANTDLCIDVARFEWARIEVFDSAALPVFTSDDLLDANPGKLKLNLQPYLRLLKLDYPVDDFLVAVRQRSELSRGEASNTNVSGPKTRASSRKLKLPRREPTFVAVHRLQGTLYFKRLEPAAYRILRAIQRGRPLADALAAGIPRAKNPREDWAGKVQAWFRNWMELGWFCRR